jgi:hypothetical protein
MKISHPNGYGMLKHTLILITLAVFVSGCTSSGEKQVTPKKKSAAKTLPKKVGSSKASSPKAGSLKADRKKEGMKFCKNIKSLKKGMSLEEVHNKLDLKLKKKYAFNKPFFYTRCYESDTVISYAEFNFFFDEGCTFRRYYPPSEKEVEKMICSGRAGDLAPPEILKY